MIRISLLLLLLCNVDEVINSVNLDIDTEDGVSGSGSGEDDPPCCSSGNYYTFYSIADALNNVTSNTIINISTGAVLSSNVTLKGVNNITIIGQGNPTVNCNDIGSVKFVSCNNVTIEGVNWERCGSVNNPGMEFNNTSNIGIQHCSFNHSTGKAVVLSKVSGNVSINNCQFTHNKYHKGHGAAIYYTSSHEQSTQLVIKICYFTLNGPAESVVYIDNSNNKSNISLLQDSTFIQNQGVPIYISHTSLVLNNIVSFKDNKATDGGAIYSSNSIIKFDDKCNVSFYNNSANNGGAIYQIHSMMLFRGNAAVTFTRNIAANGAGGAIYQTSSKIFITMNTKVLFTRNFVKNLKSYLVHLSIGSYGVGAAVYSNYSLISFEDQSLVSFNENDEGRAVFVHYTNITVRGNSTLSFTNNRAGLAATNYCNLSFGENSTVTLTGNSGTTGGAVDTYKSTVTFHGHCTATFSRNQARESGGAFAISETLLSFSENSIVKFTDNRLYGKYTIKQGGAIYSYYSSIVFDGHSNVTFSRNHVVIDEAEDDGHPLKGDGGAIFTANSSPADSAFYTRVDKINFTGNSTVIFSNNTAEDGGALYVGSSTREVTHQGNTTVKFINNRAKSGGAVLISAFISFAFTGNAVVDFCNNSASFEGGAISGFVFLFTGRSTVYFNNNLARQHGGAILSFLHSRITFNETCFVMFSSNTAMQQGGAVYLFDKTTITFEDSCNVSFNNNRALQQGGAVYLFDKTTITFGDSCNVSFNNNKALQQGGAIYNSKRSDLTIKENASVTFSNNTASLSGGAISSFDNSNILFTGGSTIHFNANLARQHGGAIYVTAQIIFAENSTVNFCNNTASLGGGAISSLDSSKMWFTGGSKTFFYNNLARQHGGAIYVTAQIIFAENSTVNFCNNTASLGGGAISSLDSSKMWFTGGSKTFFYNNLARQHGGAISSIVNARITFDGTCSIMFTSNTAMQHGGAVYLFDKSTITFEDSCRVSYNNNTALLQGGAVYFALQSNILFKEHSNIFFKSNNAIISGGALYTFSNNPVYFEDNCTILFHYNMVRQDGGAICFVNTSLHFGGSSSVTFTSNTALQQGGALNVFYNSSVVFQDESNVKFTHNTAMQHGGAVYVHDNNSVSFVGNTNVSFQRNMAESDGGALYSYEYCSITIGQYSEVMFVSNSALQCGGAMYCDHHSDVILEGPVTFTSNTAEHGGAVYVSQSIMKFANNSLVMMNKNKATEDGGGLYFSDQYNAIFHHGCFIKFAYNAAHRYGGAFYSDINTEGISKLTMNTSCISFIENKALIGDSAYLDIPTSCDETCLNRSIVGVNKKTLKHSPLAKHIHTPPSKLVLHDPAVCIYDDNETDCGTYYINNIMLGQEIIIGACVLDYYDQPAGETQFMVDSNDEDHTINGTNSVLISCTELQGINVTGSKVSDAINFSMNLTSHAGSRSDLKTISIELITELSPCHPGFHYDDKKCVCYDDNDIITCSGSTSFIRRGYWFGVVTDNSTVTVCPNNYCNFTCCEFTNGFYQLSPVRMNQCNYHRSGTACGSCEEVYTLSFDSVECVSVDMCSTGQTVLVVTLSMIYWIVIVILVFIMTYYHVGIGYLYAITYYYSMLDILLNDSLYQSKGLFTAIAIISSVVKITPQFLGQFCLVEDMSGIDQQFIHYTHPLAVSVIIVMICQAARISRRFSAFVSRGIIRTVCFLLLLSYTSVATTSLLLLKSVTFDNVDKVYTYLSPDIEYCHGRHLPYFIVAVLCTLVIVIGLPLLLLLEPFLNHKINFTRMKPLLDQFQGCYKDKYRCFAAYYMTCRLLIILIIISIPSTTDLSQFLLTFSSVVLTVIVTILKPYKHQVLNFFDGLILLLVVLATLVPLADNVSQQLSTATIIIVIILPLIFFIALELIVHKETIKAIATKITANFKAEPFPTTTDSNDIPMGDIGLVIDDNMRKNATICEISSNTSDDVTHYRESFMEVMDQIED